MCNTLFIDDDAAITFSATATDRLTSEAVSPFRPFVSNGLAKVALEGKGFWIPGCHVQALPLETPAVLPFRRQ